jgi:hypothetical protein
MSAAADERYVKGSLCSPYAGGAYVYLDPNRAGPLHAYALGYLEAAITFGEAAIRRPSDLAFYPLLHLFRHGVELALKQLAYDITKYKGAGDGPTLDHLIAGLWRQLKPDLDQWIESRRYGGEAPPESTEFDDIMVDLVRVEPTGFPSRYPTTKAGADIHPQLSTIDFAKFVHAVRRSESTLRTWMYQLSADASVQADYFAERRRTRADRAGD